jgi:hypothetical protein
MKREIPMQKAKLAKGEHRSLGKALKQIRDELQQVACELANRCGVTSREQELLFQAVSRIDRARGRLEDRLFRDYPKLGDREGFAFYYPGPSECSAGIHILRAGHKQQRRYQTQKVVDYLQRHPELRGESANRIALHLKAANLMASSTYYRDCPSLKNAIIAAYFSDGRSETVN